MKSRNRRKPTVIGLVGCIAVLALVASASTYADSSGTQTSAQGHRCVVATGSGDAAFVRNFNPFQANSQIARDFTGGGIYENLVITTAFGGGNVYNILAKSLDWSKSGKTLTITIQPNARWSDGKPLTNRDVLFSLKIGKKDKALDQIGLTATASNIASIKLAGRGKVAINFKQSDSTFIGSRLSNVWIVPARIWSKVGDVAKYKNPNPVGSGPFTRITQFGPQAYTLSKNLNYWQKGLPRIECVKRIAAASNDASLLQLINGDADWSHNFYPNVEKSYISKNKKHYHQSYLTTNLPVGLFFDLTEYPYSLPAFRKGVSLAINRSDVSRLGEYGYAPPTTALGLEQMYPKWINPSLKTRAKNMARFDPAAARSTFTAAGFTYKGGDLHDPRGNRVSYQIHVISGWSDWVASLQIITRNLQAVGIDASVKLEPDWGAWQPGAMSTKFPTLLWTYGGQDITPWSYFYAHFDPSQNLGKGVDASATGNWEHYSHATGSALLKQFKSTLNPKKQRQIANQLQKIFLDDLPFIPLFIGPRWSTYSTKYFTGFPTWKSQYVDPVFSTWPQVEKILLSLRPANSGR